MSFWFGQLLGIRNCKLQVPPALCTTTVAGLMRDIRGILCVYPLQRLKKQQSLVQFGLARSTVGRPFGLLWG